MASTGQPSWASLHWASSSGEAGLLEDKGKTAVVVPLEIAGRGFAAKVAVNALVVHVILARHVVGIFIRYISHKV